MTIHAAEQFNPLLPPLAELIVGFITFAIVAFVLMKFVWPAFEKSYAARAEAIEGGIAKAEAAQREAKAALDKYNSQLAGARAEAAKIRDAQTILELSEELGIGIEYSCRVGTCGICKVKMTSGEVTMEIDDALDADDRSNGIILACQAIPKMEIAVEA